MIKKLYRYAILVNEKMVRDRRQAESRQMAEKLLDEILHEAILDLNSAGAKNIEPDQERTRELSRDILYSIIDQVPTGNLLCKIDAYRSHVNVFSLQQ